jgi:hypothetical protein
LIQYFSYYDIDNLGTGIAPFRGFWQEWDELKARNVKIPKIWLFFGCRTNELDLYRAEKEEMLNKKILDRTFLALSRDPNIPKVTIFFKYIHKSLKRLKISQYTDICPRYCCQRR